MGRCRLRGRMDPVCVRVVRLHTTRRTRGLTNGGSYSKQREAPKPSSRHAILSFHNDRVPSRSVSKRNFNTLVYLTNPVPTPMAPFTKCVPYPRCQELLFFPLAIGVLRSLLSSPLASSVFPRPPLRCLPFSCTEFPQGPPIVG